MEPDNQNAQEELESSLTLAIDALCTWPQVLETLNQGMEASRSMGFLVPNPDALEAAGTSAEGRALNQIASLRLFQMNAIIAAAAVCLREGEAAGELRERVIEADELLRAAGTHSMLESYLRVRDAEL